MISCFIFFNDTATTEIYTLSLHDALPIPGVGQRGVLGVAAWQHDAVADGSPGDEQAREVRRPRRAVAQHGVQAAGRGGLQVGDRKSTRLNSSHANISYAVFCLKKKK